MVLLKVHFKENLKCQQQNVNLLQKKSMSK